MIELSEKLRTKVMPFRSTDGAGQGDLDTFFFWNSGAEAVGAAVKLARHATKRQGVLVFQVHGT